MEESSISSRTYSLTKRCKIRNLCCGGPEIMGSTPNRIGSATASMTTDPKAFYEEKGYLGPLRAFDAEEFERIGVVSLIESWDKREPSRNRNRHLDTAQIAKICQNERIRSIVQKVPDQEDLLLWRSNIFAVSSRAHGFSWHQDDYRMLLECPSAGAHCSVQLNFTDSTPTNCVSIIPGTITSAKRTSASEDTRCIRL